MYESPIEINRIIDRVIRGQNEAIEKEIYESVIRVGVNVDKEELIKALTYDRKQYEKGYADGVKEFWLELKSRTIDVVVFDSLEEQQDFLDWGNYLVKEMVGE